MYYGKESPKVTYAAWHLKKLVGRGFLTPITYGASQTGYFLTSAGIYLAKRLFAIPSTYLPEAPRRCLDYTWRAGDLKMHPSKLNHQEHLNTFAIKFAQAADGMGWAYFDEKFVPDKKIYSTRARADALAEMQSISLYFELDMNTERLLNLCEKWIGYRTLCASNEFLDALEQKPAAILFILDNDPKPDMRRKTVLKSLEQSGFLGWLGPNLDFYLGSADEILETTFQHILCKDSAFLQRVKAAIPLQEKIFSCEDVQSPDLYGEINGEMWSVDVYDRVRGSVLRRVLTSNSDRVFLTAAEGRPVKHLVVTNDPEGLKKDIVAINCQGLRDVYCADINDLETKPFQNALFQVNKFGARE